jgi:hypothetical protein
MNSAIEFHDSRVSSIRAAGGDLHLELSAYVHCSNGRPGIEAGSVFLQPAEVLFSGAEHEEAGDACVGSISDAIIAVDSSPFVNMLPVPFAAKGTVTALLTFASGAVLSVRANGLTCELAGDPVFVETYDG